MPIDRDEIVRLARVALEEDLGSRGDVTGETMLPAELTAIGRVVARQDLVLAGIPILIEVFRQLDPELRVDVYHRDGDRVPAGECVAAVRGRARPILAGERTALNFCMRMSGIATLTRACVDEVTGTGCDILDTRKTAPGLRLADKYAVMIGGGRNHRLGLHDEAMIKDTHLAVQPDILVAVRQLLKAGLEPRQVTVEVRDLEQLLHAIAAGAGRALLDNMDLETMRAAVTSADGRIELEASGGLQPGSLRAVAETGVDCLSLGWLTHSVKAADLAMETETGSPT
jgi:nicotinate-nucleotide pyrophosphorylase (carboxylating)